MDTTKWKSVLLPRSVYEEIVFIANVEGRTISGQLRYLFESWKNETLSKKDQIWMPGDEGYEGPSAEELKKSRANDPTYVSEEPSYSLPDD